MHNEGHWSLYNVDDQSCDRAGNMKLREWVRKRWPRKISKLLGNQSFERAFTCETAVDLMSSDSDESPVRRRRRVARNKAIVVHLTDMHSGSDEEGEMESESEPEPAYQRYDGRFPQTWWIEKGRRPGRPKAGQ